MKSVLVVGAGPAGLVAAKTLLHSSPGAFKVTVLEQKDRVGGMWGVRKGETGDKFSPEMPVNLSRFTVAFSDLDWHSVDLREGQEEANGVGGVEDSSTGHTPMFPKAWQVGKYLETYATKYLPEGTVHLSSRVIKTERIQEDGARKWKVEWARVLSNPSPDRVHYKGQSTMPNPANIQFSTSVFDYLIVGSGFFGSPRPLALDTPYNGRKPSQFPVKLEHSSQFRDLSGLVPSGLPSDGNIVVMGGGISGSEAAATAAFQLSNARYAPGTKSNYANSKIYHVFNRPFYVLTRYLPQEPYNPATQNYNLAPNFLPCDFCLYNLSRRGDGQINATNGRMPPDRAVKAHQFIRTMIGGDQRNLGYTELVYDQAQQNLPAYTGIADTYSEFVRSGVIVPVRGRVRELSVDSSAQTGRVKAVSEPPWDLSETKETILDNVVGAISATGFTPHTSISWLPQDVLAAMEHSKDSNRLPLLFQKYCVFNDNVPEIAFVGFYEGPYWGVMEMQARLIAKRWTASSDRIVSSTARNLEATSRKEIDEIGSIRQAMLQHANDVPQFWMADYVGLMESCARQAGVPRDDAGWEGQKGPCIAARYVTADCDKEEASKVVNELQSLIENSTTQARFVAMVAFRAMQGTWTLHRKLASRMAGFPSGNFKGTANFHPRVPTEKGYYAEYLYIEEGTLITDTGAALQANRRYVYRYNEVSDKISAWFVKEDGLSVDYFFNEMAFEVPSSDKKALDKGWVAKGAHLCEQDMYESSCEFRFRGASLESFGITYEVRGPKKDYTSETWYER